MMLFSQLQEITGGKVEQFIKDRTIGELLTDSRKALPSDEALFFAIRGPHHDGNQYVEELYNKGVRQFVVEGGATLALIKLREANILRVSSSLDCLQAIAIRHRQTVDTEVIGITGSNGKTIVKEWLFQLLSPEKKVAKNPGSYNSQVGVPLSVWQLKPYHQLGIFEAGISKTGEMEKLASIIQPGIGIFTNIGSAHDEGFESPEEKIREKLKLFRSANVVIYCKDHKLIDAEIRKAELPSLSWGFSSTAGIQIREADHGFSFSFKGISFPVSIPFSDKASIENCFHCISLMIQMEYPAEVIQERIQSLQSIPMRLELKDGINQSQIIDDSYNNDLGGLQISLGFLTNQHQKNRKRVILSEIHESGLEDSALAERVSTLLKKNQIDAFVGIGPSLANHASYFSEESQFFHSTEEFIDQFDFNSIQQEVVLVKGARVFQFEKIIQRLQRKVHGTVMEIDLGAVVHNLNYFKAGLKPSTKIMVMVKAFAYGSGSTEIANLLQYHKVDYLGVAYADEGIDLRRNNITLPIMVMNPSEESFGLLLPNKLEPELYSFKILNSLLRFLQGRPCLAHIKLDTGMHRLGFEESDLDELTTTLKANPNLKVASIFSHLAGADELRHDAFSREQGKRFQILADKISEALGYRPLLHLLNSPGILRLPEFQFDMVRLGIGLYGIDPTGEKKQDLRPAARLKTIISQVKQIASGDTIGYGRTGKAGSPMKLATIAIGYADGFSRSFSRGVGKILVHGKLAPVVGNVCMDMTMIDITEVQASEGDEAIIFGPDLPIEDVAGWIKTIPYEILTNTSERVKRIFIAEGI